jgi:hypothetical protein
MSKLKLFGPSLAILGAAVALVLAGGQATARKAGPHGQSIYCATREAGNPYSKLCDYQAWSIWRRRGSWSSKLDNACLHNPLYKPHGCAH